MGFLMNSELYTTDFKGHNYYIAPSLRLLGSYDIYKLIRGDRHYTMTVEADSIEQVLDVYTTIQHNSKRFYIVLAALMTILL